MRINYWSADSEDPECKYFVHSTQLNTMKKLDILKQQHTRLEKICKHEGEEKHHPFSMCKPSSKTKKGNAFLTLKLALGPVTDCHYCSWDKFNLTGRHGSGTRIGTSWIL